MLKSKKIEFEFPLCLSEKKEKEGKFIFEGFAAGNDFDLHNDIISDDALINSIEAFKKEGEFRLNHTKEVIGKILECRFEKGKIWVKTEVTTKSIIEQVKSGELNCLSIKGLINCQEKVELLPDLRLRLIKDLYLEEVSLVKQGANPEAKAIRWYVTKAIEVANADKIMEKQEVNLDNAEDEFEAVTAGEEENGVEVEEEEKVEEKKEEKAEDKKEETEEKDKNLSEKKDLKKEQVIYQAMNSSTIELSDKKNLSEFKKELLKVGKWYHNSSKNGVLDITKEMLASIAKNFKDKVMENVSVPLGHPKTDDPSKNAGEVVKLELSKEKDKLMATLDVKDEDTVEKIKKGLIKCISASFTENYTKKDTGKDVGPTLLHAALVSEPYIKGMGGFAALSDEFKDSKIIRIMSEETSVILSEMEQRIEELEKKIKLNENNNTSEETSKEETSVETPEEKTTEENSKEETKEEETSAQSKSSEVGEKTEEEEEDKTEKTSTKETESEENSEEVKADEGVELADAEVMFKELLTQGKVTPAEKDLLLPLLASNVPVELADGQRVDIRRAMKRYLESKSPVFSLEEFGTLGGNKVKNEKVPDDIKEHMDNMGLSEDVQEDAYKEFKDQKENKGKTEESTPF